MSCPLRYSIHDIKNLLGTYKQSPRFRRRHIRYGWRSTPKPFRSLNTQLITFPLPQCLRRCRPLRSPLPNTRISILPFRCTSNVEIPHPSPRPVIPRSIVHLLIGETITDGNLYSNPRSSFAFHLTDITSKRAEPCLFMPDDARNTNIERRATW